MDEPLKVRICPGCAKLHAEVNLPNRVHLFEASLNNYVDARVCDPCFSLLRESVAAAAGKASARKKKPTPIAE
jgi:hypothetical protein